MRTKKNNTSSILSVRYYLYYPERALAISTREVLLDITHTVNEQDLEHVRDIPMDRILVGMRRRSLMSSPYEPRYTI